MLSTSWSQPPHSTKTLIFGQAGRLVGILVPWPGIEPGPLAVKVQRPTTGPPVQFSCSVVYNSLRPHGLQHTRPPCPSPSPEACSNSYPLSWWCHPTISCSIVPFSSCLQSFPSGFFLVSQSIWASASASVLPMNIQGWFPLGLTGLISLQAKGLSRVLISWLQWPFSDFGDQENKIGHSFKFFPFYLPWGDGTW